MQNPITPTPTPTPTTDRNIRSTQLVDIWLTAVTHKNAALTSDLSTDEYETRLRKHLSTLKACLRAGWTIEELDRIVRERK